MAIALRGAEAVPNESNPNSSITVTIDAAVATNDLGFLTVTDRSAAAGSLPTISDNDTGGNTWAVLKQSSDGKATTWWKRATSGTASKTVTVSSLVGTGGMSGVLKWFSGCSTEATPYTDVVEESNASGNETHAGFTPTNADSMVCAAIFNYNNDNAVTSLSFATLGATTMTENLSNPALFSDAATAFGHKLQTGGPTGTGSLTWSQTNGTTYSHTWAIKPVAFPTITASGGTYTLTGTASNLLRAKLVAALAGSYALSGASVGFAKGITLAVDGGVLVLTGQNATLRVTRTLQLGPGTIVISGGSIGLFADRAVLVDGGQYVLTGEAANFALGKQISAQAGALVITGTPAALQAARRVLANGGAISLAGTDAAFVIGRLLQADAGSIAITGAAATLTVGGAPVGPTTIFNRGFIINLGRLKGQP